MNILDDVSHEAKVSVEQPLTYHIADWIHKVQSAFNRSTPATADALLSDPIVEWNKYSRLMTLVHYETKELPGNELDFVCTIKTQKVVDANEQTLVFCSDDVPSRIKLSRDHAAGTLKETI